MAFLISGRSGTGTIGRAEFTFQVSFAYVLFLYVCWDSDAGLCSMVVVIVDFRLCHGPGFVSPCVCYEYGPVNPVR